MNRWTFLLTCLLATTFACGKPGEAKSGLFMVSQGGKVGYVDKAGKYAINPQFDGAEPFSEGLAKVNVGGRQGLIDKTGRYVWNPQ
jgi:hypothetical protein